MALSVRPATPEDTPSIAEWTRDTFEWGDYVAESLADWIADDDSAVFVVTDADDRPRAVSRVRMLSDFEGWLSGARVHPDWRRQGLGTMLNDRSIEWVRERGGRVGRLAVESGNSAAVHQVEKLGYRPVSGWIFGEADAKPGRKPDKADTLRRVGRSDIDSAWMYWSTSEFYESARGMVASHWSWRRATVDDIARAAGESRLFGSAAGWVIVEPGESRIEVGWAATSQQACTSEPTWGRDRGTA